MEDDTTSISIVDPLEDIRDQREPHGSSKSVPGFAPDSAQLVIELDIIDGMSDNARERYKECITKFAGALAREASRLEEADRAEDCDKPEITTTMVVKANDLIRHPSIDRASVSIPILVAQALSFVAAILTPIFGAELHSAWQWTVTVLCGIIALVSQVFAIVTVRRR